MWFLDWLNHSHHFLRVLRKIQTIFSTVNCKGRSFSESSFVFKIARWTFTSFEYRTWSPRLQMLIALQRWKNLSLCQWKSIPENISVLSSCKKTLIVSKGIFGLAQTCSSNAQSRWEVIKHFYEASLRKIWNLIKSSGFRKHENNVWLFSNMVFGLSETFVSIVCWSLRIGTTFWWTHGTLFL